MLVVYVAFNGNTEEAFNFYKAAFEGEITNLQRFSASPDGAQMSAEEGNKIMHIALEAPNGIKIMGNDFISFGGETFNAGNNFSLSLHPDSEALADKLFKGLAEGANIIVPMGRAPWGDYFGMLTDKFGIKWMINCQHK